MSIAILGRVARAVAAGAVRSGRFVAIPATTTVATRINPRNKCDWAAPERYAETVRPPDEATTLPGDVYFDQDFFELEKTQLWKKSWVAVAETTALPNPGDVIPVTTGNAKIILANDGGTIRAFHNVCRHRGAQLVSEPCTRRRTILCPYHRWGYALDGRLMGTPSFDADEDGKTIPEKYRKQLSTSHVKDFDKKKMGLLPVRMETALGLIFVNVSGDAPPLETWLGGLLDTLGPHRPSLDSDEIVATEFGKDYEIRANWKVLMENFLEYYHLPAVHPALCNVSGVDEHRREQGTGMYCCFATDPLTAGGTAIDPGRLPVFSAIEGTSHATTAYHCAIFPNVFFSVYPDHFYRVIVDPISPTTSIERATLFTTKAGVAAETSKAVLNEIFHFWDNVNTEDINICEKVQKGVETRAYPGGRFSFRFEEPVHRFQNMVAQMMMGGEGKYVMPKGDL